MCDWHYQQLKDFMTKPVRGLDPMVPGDEYFRPSLEEMIRHAEIAIAFENRHKKAAAMDYTLARRGDEQRYRKDQIPQVYAMRRGLRS